MKLVIVILMFFILGCLLIISNNNLYLSDSEDVEKFGEMWIEWIGKIFDNLKVVTGNIVKMEWEPDN